MSTPTPPDFVIRQAVGDDIHETQKALAEKMRACGVEWARMTLLTEKQELVIEGWIKRPEDQGPEPEE